MVTEKNDAKEELKVTPKAATPPTEDRVVTLVYTGTDNFNSEKYGTYFPGQIIYVPESVAKELRGADDGFQYPGE